MEIIFKNTKPNRKLLLSFGFRQQGEDYIYTADLAKGQMKLNVTVKPDGIFTKVFDSESGDEYVLHMAENSTGSFVGALRKEYDSILENIRKECFETDIFKYEQSKAVILHLKENYGNEPEFLWEKFPDNAVFRRDDNKKWYGALLTVSRRKLGFDSDEKVEILDLRMKEEDIAALVDMKNYFPGYHMNKRHWITIILDGTLTFSEICKRIDESYALAAKK